MDLDTVFGSNYPSTYCMENDSSYSDHFATLRFGNDFLADLDVLREFFGSSSLVEDDVDLIFHSNMDVTSLVSSERKHLASEHYYGGNEYYFVNSDLDCVLEYFATNYEEAQSFGPVLRGDNFLIGFGTSWVVFYSPDISQVEALKELAGTKYGFAYSATNQHGNAVLSRREDDLGVYFLSKAPSSTIKYLPASGYPKHRDALPDAGFAILNYHIHEMEDSVRFHVDIDDAAGEIRSIFEEIGIPLKVSMVYHGVTAQRLEQNFLLSETRYNHYGENETVQNFVLQVEDAPAYLEANGEEILEDRPVFFGAGFAFGCYDRGTDFVFFDAELKAQFEDALFDRGYRAVKWWWEKPEED